MSKFHITVHCTYIVCASYARLKEYKNTQPSEEETDLQYSNYILQTRIQIPPDFKDPNTCLHYSIILYSGNKVNKFSLKKQEFQSQSIKTSV